MKPSFFKVRNLKVLNKKFWHVKLLFMILVFFYRLKVLYKRVYDEEKGINNVNRYNCRLYEKLNILKYCF